MPQYELALSVSSSGPIDGLHRARSAEEAVRRGMRLDDGVDIDINEEADVQGWQAVAVGGEPVGRVRLHQRMRFRRD